jgi:Domain of unknown function (DUF4276)
MKRLTVWVEGPGDVDAVPILLKKLLPRPTGADGWIVEPPFKVGGLPKLHKELQRHISTVRIAMNADRCHGLLVLLDLDDAKDCPVAKALELAAVLASAGLPYAAAVVFARREYEEWLVASLPSIAPATNLLPDNLRRNYPAESKRGVKEWLNERGRYSEALHQAELTKLLEPSLVAIECRSFRRLQSAIVELLTYADQPDVERRGRATPLAD